jgi:hypothetical protein
MGNRLADPLVNTSGVKRLFASMPTMRASQITKRENAMRAAYRSLAYIDALDALQATAAHSGPLGLDIDGQHAGDHDAQFRGGGA